MSAEQSAVTAPSVSRPRKADGRNANLERLRILSIFEVIAWHSSLAPTDQRLAAGWQTGMAIFLILTAMFSLTTSHTKGYRAFLLDRADKLFWPWLFWCGVYVAMRVFFWLWRDIPLDKLFHPSMLLYGSESHMWYVPFAMMVAIVVGFVQLKTANWPDGPVIAGAVVLGMPAIAGLSYIVVRHGLPTPFLQYSLATPAVFFGFAFGRAILSSPRIRNYAFAGMSLFSIPAFFYTLDEGMDFRFIVTIFLAIPIIVAAFVVPYFAKMDPVTRVCSPLMFGVYLVHIIVLRGTTHIGFLAEHIHLHAFVALVISMGIVWAMRQTPLKKFT